MEPNARGCGRWQMADGSLQVAGGRWQAGWQAGEGAGGLEGAFPHTYIHTTIYTKYCTVHTSYDSTSTV